MGLDNKILVVPTTEFLARSAEENFDFDKLIDYAGCYKLRRDMETDTNYLQIIPYVAVYNPVYKSIFTYKRINKSNETRLLEKHSIGIGGHVDDDPVFPTAPHSTNVYSSFLREVQEEVLFTNCWYPGNQALINKEVKQYNNYIYLPVDDVGKVHLGKPFLVKTTYNIISNERDKIEGGMVPIEYLLKNRNHLNLEPWSQELLNIIAKDISC